MYTSLYRRRCLLKSVTLTEARNQLLRIAEEFEKKPETIVEVLKRGKPVMTMISSELYASLMETIDILGEEDTAMKLRQALKEIEKGKSIPWETAKKRLGLNG